MVVSKPIRVESGHFQAKFNQIPACRFRSMPSPCWSILAGIGPNLAELKPSVADSKPSLVDSVQALVGFGRFRATFGRFREKLGRFRTFVLRIWPNSGPIRFPGRLGRKWPNSATQFGRRRAKFDRFRANLAGDGRMCHTHLGTIAPSVCEFDRCRPPFGQVWGSSSGVGPMWEKTACIPRMCKALSPSAGNARSPLGC